MNDQTDCNKHTYCQADECNSQLFHQEGFTKYKIIFINSYITHKAKSRHDGELIENIQDNMFLDLSCYHHCFMTVWQDNYNVQLVQNSKFEKYVVS